MLQELERAEPEQVTAGRGQVLAHVALQVDVADVVADHLDLARVAAAEAGLVREADVLDAQRVEAEDLRRHGVDRDLVGAGEHEVGAHRDHGARAGAVAAEGAVHHAEEAAVDLLLDVQQVDERLVDDRVRVVAVRVEQAAEGVLHGAGGGRVDVALHGRQVDDVLALEVVGHLDAVWEDRVESEHLRLRLVTFQPMSSGLKLNSSRISCFS